MNEYVLSKGYGEKLSGGNMATCSILKLVHEGKILLLKKLGEVRQIAELSLSLSLICGDPLCGN